MVLAATLALLAGSVERSRAEGTKVCDLNRVRIETAHPHQTAAGGEGAWRQVIQRPQASYIALHFEQFDLGQGARVEISDPSGQYRFTYTGKGKGDLGSFWATHIPGDTAVVELISSGTQPGFGFVIDQVAQGYPAPEFTAALRDGAEAICGVDDSREAQCYETTEPAAYDRGRAVARLIINGCFCCTGWLLGSEGHVVTNNHCIANAAETTNTDFEFLAERSCATDCTASGACAGTVIDGSTATFVTTDSKCNLDYTLVKLPADPSPRYGYLTLRPTGAVDGEQMYIVGHPAGWGKQISLESDDPADPNDVCTVDSIGANRCDPDGDCASVTGPSEVGYMCDTQGGSSGSPVLGYNDNEVIALHHCANCPNRGERIQDIITDLGNNVPIDAISRGDRFGSALVACDFNNDGESDLAIGVPEEDVGAVRHAGMVNVLYGTHGQQLQTTAPADQSWTQNSSLGGGPVEGSSELGDRFGGALAGGDFNDDGFCDLAIGVPGESIGADEDAGFVNVLYGSAAGLQTTAPADQGWSQDSGGVEGSSGAGDLLGTALAAGDFNNDGYDDLAIGAPGESIGAVEDAGFVNVLYGSAAGLQTAAPADQGWSQDSSVGGGAVEGTVERGDRFGSALAAGDFDNNGADDLAVGVPNEEVNGDLEAGFVNVLYGRTGAVGLQTTTPVDQGWSQDSLGVDDSAEEGDHFGRALAAGDFDNDGADDLAVGVPEEDLPAADGGLVAVLYGDAGTGLQTTAPTDDAWTQNSAGVEGAAEQGDRFGAALAAGDFDNNGVDDLAIGVPEEDLTVGGTNYLDAGYVNVLYGVGGGTGLQTAAPTDQGWHQNSTNVEGAVEKGDHFGKALAAGDFDSNGADDLATGVPEEDITSGAGNVPDTGFVNVLYGVGGGTKLQTTAPADDGWHQNSTGVNDSCE
ncbi:MAG: FG-GAP repeat protein [Deltaproteobacteria bacterium]|nr:FG-GAP repeat protein [Deltaproteobacteria bacterium]